MSHIKFFALGGLGEDGKNMYCLDIDNDIFILDAGLKYPNLELFGVDAILPDFSYLVENKNRVRALFLSHGHEDHIGAVPKLIKEIEVPVYGTFFTLALLKDALTEQGLKPESFPLHTITKDSVLDFNQVQVSFYQTTHSIPESVGIALDTKDGVIVYSPDYTFDQNVDIAYRTSFERLARIAHKPVLALLTESLGSEHTGHTHTSKSLDLELNKAFMNTESRIVVSVFSTDISRIQKIINIALKHHKDIAIIGRKAQRMVDIAINLGVLKIPDSSLINLKFIDENNQNELKNTVILVTGNRHEPFHMIQRMVRKADRLIHLNESDSVLLMTPPVPGTEKIAARTLDVLYRHNIPVSKIDKSMLPPAHASSEDIKLLVNILNPKYFIPVIGEYRHFYAMRKIAHALNYDDDHIKILDNGQVLEFINKEAKEVVYSINSGDILVDGILEGDLSDVVLKDREVLSQDGVVLIISNIDARKKKLLGKPEIVSRGFVYMKENEALMDKISEIYIDVAKTMFKENYIDWRNLRDKVREQVSRYLYQTTNRRPIVIPVLIDTQKASK